MKISCSMEIDLDLRGLLLLSTKTVAPSNGLGCLTKPANTAR